MEPDEPDATGRTTRVTVESAIAARLARMLGSGRAPGTVVLVEGPPGIGKSHLLDRLCADAGVAVRRARGDERRSGQGFAVVADLVGPVPEDAHPADHAFERVDAWCQDGPVLLCVDDAHHLDAASLGVLRRLAWATRDLPLALLVAARPFPVSAPLDTLRRMAARYPLPALDRVAVEALVFERTGSWPARELGDVLARAAGNPLFVVEVLRDLDARGALRTSGDRIDVDAGATVPDRLDAAVRGHLAELGDAERELVAALAVLGPTATVGELAGVLYQPAELVTATATSVSRTGMVRCDADRVSFTHDLYREAAYGSLDDLTRRSTHRRAAEVLAGPAATEHLRRAAAEGTDPAVVDALREEARRSSAFAPAVSAELLAQAEPLLARADERRDGVLLERATALFLSGQGRAVADLVTERLPEVGDRQVAARLVAVRIRALINRGDVAEALATIDATLSAPGLPGPVVRQLAQVRCWLLLLDGRLGPAVAEAEELRRVGADDEPSAALLTLACAAHLHARPLDAQRLLGDVERAPLPGDQLSGRMTALVWPSTFDLAARGPRAARETVARARRITTERGAGWLMPFHAFVAGGVALAAGEWDEAVAELDTGLEVAQEYDSGWISIAVGRRAYIDAHRGRVREARARLTAFRASGLPLQFGHDQPGLADLAVLEAEGAGRAAVTLARELWSAAAGRGEAWMLAVAPDVARVALSGMERELLGRVAADVAALDAAQDCTAGPTASLVAGMRDGDRDGVERAAHAFAATGWEITAAYAWEEAACLSAVEDDRPAAVEALERAHTTFDRAGASVDRDRLLSRLRVLGVRRGPRFRHGAAIRGWGALTPTERRVAALVREGRTNPEIAAALFVSPRTVQTHVSHILGKLGVRSRVEVASGRWD